MTPTSRPRVLSGMRPTGKLHLGNYMGALANWVKLQQDYECYFFIADWHALTTDYADPSNIRENTMDVALDWLAAGLDPERCVLFVQSLVPQHAELHLLLEGRLLGFESPDFLGFHVRREDRDLLLKCCAFPAEAFVFAFELGFSGLRHRLNLQGNALSDFRLTQKRLTIDDKDLGHRRTLRRRRGLALRERRRHGEKGHRECEARRGQR